MSSRLSSFAGLLAVSASCSGPLDRSALGEAVAALGSGYCITDVVAEPVTYHFDSPRWVLDAAEGAGPRVLALTVAGFAGPLVSTTVTEHPKESDLSSALNYNVADLYYLQASAAYTVTDGKYAKLEAYINYARSAWVVREAGCGAVLGTGLAFKPIGVYFAARDTDSMAIPGASVVGLLPDANGGPGGYQPYPDEPSDAGTGDAGTGDASTGDAGTDDAGKK